MITFDKNFTNFPRVSDVRIDQGLINLCHMFITQASRVLYLEGFVLKDDIKFVPEGENRFIKKDIRSRKKKLKKIIQG